MVRVETLYDPYYPVVHIIHWASRMTTDTLPANHDNERSPRRGIRGGRLASDIPSNEVDRPAYVVARHKGGSRSLLKATKLHMVSQRAAGRQRKRMQLTQVVASNAVSTRHL
jgi:hypothetical protein